jgi:hypothetical protein
MKNGIRQIIGKSVSGVVLAENDERSPRTQLFLTFSDGTYLEIWGDEFTYAGAFDRGTIETASAYAKKFGSRITEIHPSPASEGEADKQERI